MKSLFGLVAGAIVVVGMTGCSTLNIGKEQYACPGMPNGISCKSTSEVYEMTNNGNVPLPMHAGRQSEKEQSGDIVADDVSGSGSTGQIYVPSPRTAKVAKEYIAPNLGRYPIPIRTPAKVMRIWIAPFEDKGGDLVMPGFVYTEIEPRRWVIGEEGRGGVKGEYTSRPLSVK